jgi:integrase
LAAGKLFVDEVVAAYLSEHAKDSISRVFLHDTARPIVQWWSGKKLSEINEGNCKAFVKWRTAQKDSRKRKRPGNISIATARHNLKTLRSAIHWYHRAYGPLPSVPKVSLPPQTPQRADYWLSRDEVAARIRVARKNPRWRHVVRQLLIGVYTGTRPGAILALRWTPSTDGGWFDLDSGTLHRQGMKATRSNKRQPSVRIHARLLPHLRRWKAVDMARGITSVISYHGERVQKLRRSWHAVAVAGGASRKDSPHITRHTAATWQMQAGTNVHEASGYLGMSVKVLLEVYGHHHPDHQAFAASADGRRKSISGSQSGSRRSHSRT